MFGTSGLSIILTNTEMGYHRETVGRHWYLADSMPAKVLTGSASDLAANLAISSPGSSASAMILPVMGAGSIRSWRHDIESTPNIAVSFGNGFNTLNSKMGLTIEELLHSSRRELLDLSTRNRLLSIPVDSGSARIVSVRDETSDLVYRLLVEEKRVFSFLPAYSSKSQGSHKAGAEDLLSAAAGSPPDRGETEDIDEEPEIAKRHTDCLLQTSLSSEGLQRRLLDLYHDSRAMMDEAGVNILYLALGHMKWYEADKSDTPRYAPLILVPVELSRKTASEKFVLRCTEDEIVENLSLYAKLQEDFGIVLPAFDGGEDLDVTSYFDAVSKVVAKVPQWEIQRNEITLGFFSFAKFLMFRDLDPKTWPDPAQLIDQPLIAGLLQDGFPIQSENIFTDDSQLDDLIPVAKLDHVVDADATQTLAIESVRQGRSLVVQGPPGTGKSQSITNIIATAVLDGKKVLFVAEKLAALQVVQRRLQREGLGDICLELHSNKSNKKAVIEELGRTWALGRPQPKDLESMIPKLQDKRNILNQYVRSIHQVFGNTGLTAFAVIGQLSLLDKRGLEANELTFNGAEDWTADQRQTNHAHIEELANRIDQIGLPANHPWRGTLLTSILQIDLDPLCKRINQTISALDAVVETCTSLAGKISQKVPATFAEVDEQLIIVGFVISAPAKADKAALCSSKWNADLEPLRDLLTEGKRFTATQTQLEGKVIDAAWDKDFREQRQQIAAHGKSLLRIFNRQYRSALADAKGVARAGLPNSHADRLALIDAIIIGQQALRKLREQDGLGQEAFGTLWKKEKSDWPQLLVIVDWVAKQTEIGLGKNFRVMFAGITDIAATAQLVEQVAGSLAVAKESAQRICGEVNADLKATFGVGDFKDIGLRSIQDRLRLWMESISQLPAWTTYVLRSQLARAAGIGSLIDFLETGKILTKHATDAYDRVYYSQLLRSIVRQKPELAHFDAELHERHIADFRGLDNERLALAKYRILQAHFDRMPPQTAVGAAGIVKSEMERKRGHRSVRRLLRDAGSVVQAIKPVFLMSPLSVAQFLEPGAVEFDMLVIDEASQVQPVDSLGAVARCKQIVVVGDSKQLPPTKFFARMTSDVEEEDEDWDEPQAAQAADIESILGLCRARGLPEKMLRWHYRSRHHSLIAVSNHEFYEDRLFVVPSPYPANPELGLKFQLVEGGVFDSGASATNRVEARAVSKAIVEHAKTSPHLSLGVAAFSVKQQKAIRDELELARRQEPAIEDFFANHSTEPFFCKNLENVQGDERDVIFISVGYGRNSSGYMAMRFGPLGAEGGERRLNVLISRAKKRCQVFASITADDIDLERARGQGVAALKVFLNYAQTGRLGIAIATGREEESPFEQSVRRAVESLGYEVVPQVGEAGFFIDLGVRDRKDPGRFILGIECDGAAYHSSRSARDRDRLRQAVLEDHGWVIYRIWSTDWFQKPVDQLRKISAAIEAAKNEVRPSVAAKPEQVEEIDRDAAASSFNDDSLAKLSQPYVVADFVATRYETASHMAELVLNVIKVEGPIHEDEVVNRVKTLWGYSRAGSRIQAAVNAGISALVSTGKCDRAYRFLFIPGAPVQIRNRENVASAELRKPEMISGLELQAAILAVIDLGHGAAAREIPAAVAKLLGFKTTAAQLRYAVENEIHRLSQQNVIVESNRMLKRA